MTLAAALQKLARMIDPLGNNDIPVPVLQDALTGRERYTTHAISTAYAVGARVVPSPGTGRLYRCRIAGTSAATAPSWPAQDKTPTREIDDGDDLVWEDIGPVRGDSNYDLDGAAYDACMTMARANAVRFDVVDNGVQLRRSQIMQHWMAMASAYSQSSEIC